MIKHLIMALTISTIGTATQAQEVTITEREYGGYILSYTNKITHIGSVSNGDEFGVSWYIDRTNNSDCLVRDCTDTIHVTPPEGYIAVPPIAKLDEGQSVDIYIVEENMS